MALMVRGVTETDSGTIEVLVGVGAAEGDRGEVPVQPGRVKPDEPIADIATAEATWSMRPARASRARPSRSSLNSDLGVPSHWLVGQPDGDQHGDDLAVSEMGSAAHGHRPIDDGGHVEAFQHQNHSGNARSGSGPAPGRVG